MNAPSPAIASLYVAAGGAVGSVLRFQAGRLTTHVLGVAAATAFPWGTLLINVTGSLAMGALVGFLARHGQGGEHWRLFIAVGVLGGYTTFSTFSLEMMMLVERNQPGLAFAYMAASVVAGFAALWLGLVTMRAVG